MKKIMATIQKIQPGKDFLMKKLLYLRLLLLVLLVSVIIFNVSPVSAKAGNSTASISTIYFDLNKDGKNEYETLLMCNVQGVSYQVQSPKEKKYTYMKQTTYSYNQIYKGKKIGQIDLILDSFLDGSSSMLFLNYFSEKNITLKFKIVSISNSVDGEITSIKKLGNTCSYATESPIQNQQLPNSVFYFENKDRFIKFEKVINTSSLGSSVYEVDKNNTTIDLNTSDNQYTFSYDLKAVPNKEIRANWIFSLSPMVDWKDDLAYRTALNMDYYNDNKYFNDGIYRKIMYNYLPRSENKACYFKNPSGFSVRACKWVLKKGSLFQVMGLYGMYSFAEAYNDMGYIPTQPKSEWLSSDFNIGYNFYDTRFNSDTVSSLINIYKDYPDEFVKQKIDKYISFFKKYYNEKQFQVKEATFVPDYMDLSGENKINPASLNHFLAEAQALFEYYEISGDQESLKLGRRMLNSIAVTVDCWIRNDGDLWYRVTPQGVYCTDDYPLVTYNDLVFFTNTLKRIEGRVPPQLEKLLDSKSYWAQKKGFIK